MRWNEIWADRGRGGIIGGRSVGRNIGGWSDREGVISGGTVGGGVDSESVRDGVINGSTVWVAGGGFSGEWRVGFHNAVNGG